ncbi:MAG: ABC transporter ATP-binding protein [Armatimonadetes bacterium]|nr:ABC transporter ATP-binding protein [Armatimonadota bacterium]
MRHLRRLAPYAKKNSRLIAISLFCSLLAQGAFLAMPKILGDIVDQVFRGGHRERLPYFALLILLLSLFRGLINFVEIALGARFGQRILQSVRQDLYAHLCRLSFSYFDRTRTGQLISRITSDMEPVSMFLTWGFRMVFKNTALFFGVVIVCLRMHVMLTIVSLSALPLLTLTAMVIGGRLRPAYEAAREQLGVLTSALQENLQGIRLVKMYVREQEEIARFHRESELLREKNYLAQRLDSIYYPITGFWAGAAGLLVLWYGGLQVINGSLSLGEYVAFESYVVFMTMPMRMLGFMVSGMLRADASMERVHAIIDSVPDLTSPQKPVASTPIEGKIQFENVRFGFKEDSPILRDLFIEVEAGETIGIMGPTGSGKSALVSLIPRFYDPQAGRVLIDGHDVRELDLPTLRSQVAIVLQDTFLFSGTIRENITYARPEAPEEALLEAARKAAIHEFLQQLPEGYDTVIGERGVRLSGGQQQRLAIARSLLTDPRILILDDCTSSVDTYTEHLIQESINAMLHDRTTIIIAQRASAVMQADRILVLDEGRIVESGSPSELREDPTSLFARLLHSQQSSADKTPFASAPIAERFETVVA